MYAARATPWGRDLLLMTGWRVKVIRWISSGTPWSQHVASRVVARTRALPYFVSVLVTRKWRFHHTRTLGFWLGLLIQVCRFSLLSGRKVRWPLRMLPPGEFLMSTMLTGQTDRRTDTRPLHYAFRHRDGFFSRPGIAMPPAGLCFTDITFFHVAPVIRQRVDASQHGLLR